MSKLLFILFIFSSTISNSQDLKIKGTVTYSQVLLNSGRKLDLFSDGTFKYEKYSYTCFLNGNKKEIIGNYNILNNKLFLKPYDVVVEIYEENKKLKSRKELHYSDIGSIKINTNYDILVWNNRSYLLSEQINENLHINSENDYHLLSHSYNSGNQPDQNDYLLTRKINNTNHTNLDLSKIPDKWRTYYLEKPISAKIKRIIKEIDTISSNEYLLRGMSENEEIISYNVTIDKGTNHGVKCGHTFFIDKNNKYGFRILETFATESRGYYLNFDEVKNPIGTELKTNWK